MTPEEEEARDRLLFHLENQEGFWFALVVSDDARPRARLCEVTRAWCGEHGKAFTLHEPEPEGLVKLAVALAKVGNSGVHWIRADGVKGLIEAWNAGAVQLLMAMNERREAYRKRFEGGVVVEGRLSLKRILREMAPDLFSIRAFIAEPGEDRHTAISEFPEWREPVSLTSLVSEDQIDPNLALERLARLAVIEGLVTTPAWVDAEGRAMNSLYNAGRYDEAGRHAAELITRLGQSKDSGLSGYSQRVALAYDVLAQISLIKGEDIHKTIYLLNQALNCLLSDPVDDPEELLFFLMQAIQIGKQKAQLLALAGDDDSPAKIFEQFVRAIPSTMALPPEMQMEVLGIHLGLANALQGQKDGLGPAADALQKAAQLAEQISSKYPEDDRWKLEVFRCQAALGRVQLRKMDIAAALKTIVAVAELAERLGEYGSESETWRAVMEGFYFDMSFILSHQVNYDATLDRMRERALSSVSRQFEREPDNLELGWLLANFYLQRIMLLEMKDPVGAKEAAQKALELVPRLSVRSAEDSALKAKIEALRSFVRKPRKRRRPAG